MSELIFLTPVKKQTIWGGNSLAEEYGFGVPGEAIAEAWAVSAHPHGDCPVTDGPGAGGTLSELWRAQPALFGAAAGGEFPLLVKFIDAEKDLSIQVHPDDAYAMTHENGARGKSECWYILDCREGAQLVLGHHAATREEARRLTAENRWDELLRRVPVHKGDFFRIDPGTVHAIGAGIRILETQQNSDITYRLYDYGRLQNGLPRPLHLEPSLAVMTVPGRPVHTMAPAARRVDGGALTLLESCPYFTVNRLEVNASMPLPGPKAFYAVTLLEGKGTLNGRPVQKGQSLLVSTGAQPLLAGGSFCAVVSAPGPADPFAASR